MSFSYALLPKLTVFIAALAFLLALGCGSGASPTRGPVGTLVPPPTATPVPTPTPEPTSAPTPTPTKEPERAAAALAMNLPESLLPEGAGVVVDFYPSEGLDAAVSFTGAAFALGGIMPDSVPGGSIDEMVEAVREEGGIDLRAVIYAEMFMDMEPLVAPGLESDAGALDFGIALYGEFVEEEIIASLKANESIEHEVSDYRGFAVHLLQGGADGDMAVSIIRSDTMLIGANRSVEAMLDVASGEAPPLSGKLRQALDSLGDRHMGFAVRLEQGLLDDMTMGAGEEDALPQMGLLGAVDMTALTAPVSALKVAFDGNTMNIAASSFFDDSVSATASKEYSEGTIAVLGAMLADSPELQDFASGMEVTQSGDVVTVSMSVTVQVIEELFAGMGTMTMEQN